MNQYVFSVKSEDLIKARCIILLNQLGHKFFYEVSRKNKNNTSVIDIRVAKDPLIAMGSMKEVSPMLHLPAPMIPIFKKGLDIIINVQGNFNFICNLGTYDGNVVVNFEEKKYLN